MNKILITLVLVLGNWQVALAQNLIFNATFDANVDGWVIDPVNIVSTGSFEWDSVSGQPPGALRFVGENQSAFTESCIPARPGSYYLRADAFMETGGDQLFCSIDLGLYETTDCSDSFGFFLTPPWSSWAQEMNQWEQLEYNIVGVPGELFGPSSTFKAVRLYLTKGSDLNEDDACLFDNVSLEYVAPASIPTANPTGLAVLVVLLTAAAFVVLRKRAFEK